ncbi:MAG: ABC transporter permease/substrate-binding protein [Xanthobacteraceae bacterium]
MISWLTSDPRVAEAFARLPDFLGNHVIVCVLALVLGLAVSLPLALLCMKRPALRATALSISSIVQTIPGLALLALFYPLLLGLAAFTERTFGFSFSALGLLPSVLALMLYSMLPVLRNTITGLEGVDPAIKQAAIGVGMTPRQSLFIIEWPLALPVIMAGIRTAAVWVIGAATLSTPIGQTSLGNYIFTGLQTQNWVFVLFGCVAAAVLAIVVDQLLALIETGVAKRRRGAQLAGLIGLLLVASLSFLPGAARNPNAYVIGAKPFAEQYILAALIQQRLEADGHAAVRREGLGSAVVFDALAAGEIDIYVEYTGTIWANQMKRTEVLPRTQVLAEVKQWLESKYGIKLAGGLGFENAYTLAMTKIHASELGVRTVTELARHAPQLSIAGDYEFFGRPEWKAMRDAYGLTFRAQRQMQPEFMYPAVASREVDVISAYTSDGRIAQYNLQTIEDDRHAIPPYDAIILLSPKRANDAVLLRAIAPLIDAITVENMREANRRVSADASASPQAAAQWLREKIKSR